MDFASECILSENGVEKKEERSMMKMKKRTKPKMNQEHLDEPNQKQKGLNKPYDSAFKSIVQKCPRLALFLIDEMFYQNGVISK